MSPPTSRIYLDHNATTPLHPEVVESMVGILRDVHGNPSSTHEEGAIAHQAVTRAREQVAGCIGASPREIVFTGGATEANNTVLKGVVGSGRILTTQTEHPSVEVPLARIEQQGVAVERMPVDEQGRLSLETLERALEHETRLVTIIWANNETGVLQPMHEIAMRVKARGALLHVDATQAVGKAEVDLREVPADFLSCSAHKLNGPKGVGCLFLRAGTSCAPLLEGGPQERRFRGGTENVAGIVGFGRACVVAHRDLAQRIERYGALRERLWHTLESSIPAVRRNGAPDSVLCNTLSVEFEDTAGDVLLQALDLDGVAVSAGAACHSGSIAPSHVLTAMGRTPEQARGTLRLSVGLGNTDEQIGAAVRKIAVLVSKVRAAGPG